MRLGELPKEGAGRVLRKFSATELIALGGVGGVPWLVVRGDPSSPSSTTTDCNRIPMHSECASATRQRRGRLAPTTSVGQSGVT